MKFHHTVLPNGLKVIAECNPHALSAAVGVFVRAGSRDEPDALSGVSHFLEHMAFKGSNRRTAEELNSEFDDIGAKYNAYTTEEHTVYHAAVLPEYLPRAIDLISDLLRPSLRSDDFDLEKKVIIEEIGMYADSPLWTAYECAMRQHFADHPIGNSVLGTEETIGRLTSEQMRAYHSDRYLPGNLLLAAAGNVDWEHLVDIVHQYTGDWAGGDSHRELRRSYSMGRDQLIFRDSFVQECACLISAAPPADSPLRFAADLLASIVGDDTGSRFHWELTDQGRVESADFNYHEYEGLGMFMTSLTCDPRLTEENLQTVHRIFDDLACRGITSEELLQAKNKLASRIVLAAERPQNRLSSLGYNWSYRNEYRSVSADLEDLDSVTLEQVQELLATYPLRKSTCVCLGPQPSVAALKLT